MDYREKKAHGDDAFPVEILKITPNHFRYRMNLHWHPEHEILYVESGSIRVTLNETAYDLKKGDVLLIQSGALHSAIPKDCVYDCILVNLPLFMKENDACMPFAEKLQNGELWAEPLLGGSDSFYADACEKIAALDPAETDAYPFLAKGLIFGFFGRLIAEKRFRREHLNWNSRVNLSGRLKAAVSYIEKNYALPIRLPEIAKQAEMSAGHFSRCFKTVTNMTPFEYMTRYRLSKAQYALVSTDMSITEIALDCGFTDASYFICAFRKAFGMTPRQYRMTAGRKPAE